MRHLNYKNGAGPLQQRAPIRSLRTVPPAWGRERENGSGGRQRWCRLLRLGEDVCTERGNLHRMASRWDRMRAVPPSWRVRSGPCGMQPAILRLTLPGGSYFMRPSAGSGRGRGSIRGGGEREERLEGSPPPIPMPPASCLAPSHPHEPASEGWQRECRLFVSNRASSSRSRISATSRALFAMKRSAGRPDP